MWAYDSAVYPLGMIMVPDIRIGRRMNGHRGFLAALVLAGLLIAAGCGSDSLAGRRTVNIGLYQNAPKVYTAANGKPAGLFVELIEAVAKAEGWTLNHVPCEWADCLRRTMAAPPEVRMPHWVKWSLIGAGAGLLLISVSLLLRWQVAQRTRDLLATTRELEIERASLEHQVAARR